MFLLSRVCILQFVRVFNCLRHVFVDMVVFLCIQIVVLSVYACVYLCVRCLWLRAIHSVVLTLCFVLWGCFPVCSGTFSGHTLAGTSPDNSGGIATPPIALRPMQETHFRFSSKQNMHFQQFRRGCSRTAEFRELWARGLIVAASRLDEAHPARDGHRFCLTPRVSFFVLL